ncbi:extracellular solute-binding protein [Phaeacidiphilus oryzae]|jgi:ABC-type glycerol-3-phosphate transport system substrate-binding protein|uniref:extracellular solute-binding protein n=1 Tax=Phaeacidiphilus oryzae TaxID=348818 RepID=UPI00068F25CF|nr:extracellular solute-binding protein [Phaeacidiphilus oryzae]
MTFQHRRGSARERALAAAALAAATGLILTACSSGGSGGSGSADANGKVTISIDCQPPTSKPALREMWNQDIAAFEKAHPDVTVKSIDTFPCETPALFTAALKGGTEANVFYTYFTDKQQVLDAGQAADITKYVNTTTVPALNDIKPEVLATQKENGKLYGLPTNNYTMGMIINRRLFKQAGLNPDQPPTTWADVAKDAQAISKLGHGAIGYGDYSAGNNGGWHFAAELDAMGGRMTTPDGSRSAFDSAQGRAVLQNLHDLRFTDGVMGTTQLYKWGDLQKLMAAGKLGMYLAAPDDITYMVQTLGAHYSDFSMGPMPGQNGPGAGTLAGGNDYMFNVKDTPAQIKAGVELVDYIGLTVGHGQLFDYARLKAKDQAVGLPEPALFQGATKAQDDKLKAANATMPVSYFSSYADAAVPGIPEPPNAQAIYKILDSTMAAVLTNSGADIGGQLHTAAQQVDQVLANSQ